MATAETGTAPKVVWIDLSSSDAAGSREFYSKLFGWDVQVNPDPQYGGYALAKIDGKDVGGIGPSQSPGAPTAWMVYVGAGDADAAARKVQAAGGTVVSPAFDVGDQGRMAVFQDPSGAFISVWQSSAMRGFMTNAPGSFGWAELNARGVDRAIPFYEKVFGWKHRTNEAGEDAPPYTEFLLDGQSIAGAWEMNPMVPANVPSYWTVYFTVDDVDASFKKAMKAGAREQVAPQDFPGGRFAIVSDLQGASFGIMQMAGR